MYCWQCGKQIEDLSKFCTFCGSRVPSGTRSPDQPPVQQTKPVAVQQPVQAKTAQRPAQREIILTLTEPARDTAPSLDVGSLKEDLLSFKGRRGRLSYFWINLVAMVLIMFFSNLSISLLANKKTADWGTLMWIVALIPTYISATNIAKRLHDLNKPTSWAVFLVGLIFMSGFVGGGFLAFVWLISTVVGIYLTFVKGTAGKNDYGDPVV